MKLVTFKTKNGNQNQRRVGAINQQLVIDLSYCFANLLSERGVAKPYINATHYIPTRMIKLIELGNQGLSHAHEAVSWFEHQKRKNKNLIGQKGELLAADLSEVKLLAPLPRPRSLRDFMAFEEHTKVGWARRNAPVPKEWYEMPVYYKGNCDTIIGPDQEVVWPQYTNKLDYELELGAVIGKKGKNIKAQDAKKHIYGFTIINDFSARDIQAKEMICRLGPAKGKDFATGMGPWLVTIDEIGNFENLNMSAKINGEVWSQGNSGTRYWSFAQMIEHVSQDEYIYPGDVFGSGTVGGGCGLELDKWVQPGDVVELEIDKLGILKNTIGSK
jgi:2-keto-4-pentenoate hydratase/2-oxohepta-3-ene-1,7-dioic acid hydratase in catechol pathway